MTSKTIAAFAAFAALAAPTAATASKPADAGSKGKGHTKAKNAVFTGSIVSADATAKTVVLHVVKANKWGRSLKDSDVTFDVSAVKKIGIADTNGDGVRDLNDVKGGEKAQAQAKIAKDAPQPFAARKFKVYVPDTSESETETEGAKADR